MIASAPVSGGSASACTNEVWLAPIWGLWVWRRRINRRPCCFPMSNPSTSPWTARSDGSRRWDNRMAAQHLPRDLVQLSSGYKELDQEEGHRRSGCKQHKIQSPSCWEDAFRSTRSTNAKARISGPLRSEGTWAYSSSAPHIWLGLRLGKGYVVDV